MRITSYFISSPLRGGEERQFLVYSFLFLVKEKINNIKKMQMIIIDFYSK